MDSNCPNELKSLSGNRVSLKMVETYSFLDKGFDLMRFVETCYKYDKHWRKWDLGADIISFFAFKDLSLLGELHGCVCVYIFLSHTYIHTCLLVRV